MITLLLNYNSLILLSVVLAKLSYDGYVRFIKRTRTDEYLDHDLMVTYVDLRRRGMIE